ncbi:MAG: MBL fold metallo-hydrolase [Gammaproteobacteria bacterium]|nr:MBL fold metallo-hydrolase [Gammaproteobacteria bacterium]
MSERVVKRWATIAVMGAVAVLAYTAGRMDQGAIGGEAFASTETDAFVRATRALPERDAYFPNSEDLGPEEMRIISCGTGMPSARESQAASCFLVELGNGDKFIFDGGTGSDVRIGSLEIPYDLLDKIFISHLHTDHWGSFPAYYVGGWVAGRTVPLRVWGPSGSRPELGTAYAMEHIKKVYSWDIEGRTGRLPPAGGELEVHEFDYRGVNEIVYQENGVTIRSFPQIHSLDGSVGYTLEWNGLKFVYGGDSYPSKTFVNAAQDADVVIHEIMMAAEDWIKKYKFPPARALEVGTQIHTSPEAFGKIMSLVKPRMAIGFHFFNDFDTVLAVESGMRSTYDGPVTLATDYLVWNVTKDDIKVREVVVNENAWPPAGVFDIPPMDTAAAANIRPSDWVQGQALDVTDVDQAIYDRINEQYGLDVKMRMKEVIEASEEK